MKTEITRQKIILPNFHSGNAIFFVYITRYHSQHKTNIYYFLEELQGFIFKQMLGYYQDNKCHQFKIVISIA